MTPLLAQESAFSQYDSRDKKIFELIADNIDTLDHRTAIATGNAVIVGQDMYVIADYIKYDTVTREADIAGNVKFYRGGSQFMSAQKARFRLAEDYSVIEPFYLQDSATGVWISAKVAESRADAYDFKSVVVSGCDIDNPIWHIEGTSGYYNQDSAIASIWNPRIYIKNFPVFYLPYFFLSTQNKRTTGLLYPEFATSVLDGFIYAQPFFLALQDFWDMTFTPQIRTSRGFGGNLETRILDPFGKIFTINAGFFSNTNAYRNKYNIPNKYVYGFNLTHARRNLIHDLLQNLTDIGSDGLFLDFRYMNDLDYIRLQSTKNTTIENRIQTSRANYFINNDSHFFGLYFKYFLDLSRLNNDTTFQTLPHLQYHRYMEQTALKNLAYSIDLTSKNITRRTDFGYTDTSFRLPFYFAAPIAAGYLTIGANANINADVLQLNNLTAAQKRAIEGADSTYFGATYGFFLQSDVARQYDQIFHTMSFGASFKSPVYEYFNDDNGVFAPDKKGTFGLLNNVAANDQQVSLTFSQYFFGLGAAELVYHRMYQTINPNIKDSPLGSLRNELGFVPFSGVNVGSTIFYSHLYREIEEASLSLSLSFGYFQSSLTYFIKKRFTINNDNVKQSEESANFLRLRLSHDFGYFAVWGDMGYDFKLNYLRDWNVVLSKDIRCFGIGVRFANEIVPILTAGGSRTVNNLYVSLELRFVPVTAASYAYRFKEKTE